MRSSAALLILSLLSVGALSHASPVNVNLSTPDDIAKALEGVDLPMANRISVYCALKKCMKPEDLLNVEGMNPSLLQHIRPDLFFDNQQEPASSNDECS
ncbi:hypothetical protein [Thiomicrorhabdus cannonii]|uniref:hypothetical protein n=1 Tax=Thiomicrorhabdus cannonii TaxID=2748011 RepID=UPI0015B9432C|nr:hypothetical protein [Thiomicrorhabdus cannonii]